MLQCLLLNALAPPSFLPLLLSRIFIFISRHTVKRVYNFLEIYHVQGSESTAKSFHRP